MKWEFKNGIPIYLQIVDQIKRQIVSGELAPGSRIPAVRDLAQEAGVNPNTMQRALTQLEQEGLLHTQRTRGRFVTDEEEVMRETRQQLSREYIAELYKHLRELGLDREEIVAAVSAWEDTDK
ncbi:GntR family transcriptional regulator [Clostridium vitabionis]|uniref:GntR family transcriptional regulator n=1 Tax=Clostridium vitabionis TaxID=2784388 RepID=UPI00188C58B7|nr:GntR family transcriptional regulator [Clostridium vitabionis]